MLTVPCECGAHVSVEPAQAGTTTACRACQRSLVIPSVSELRRLAGDATPYHADLDRLQDALSAQTGPFSGQCQQCGSSAHVERSVEVSYLVRRDVTEPDGLQVSTRHGLPSVALVVGATVERWQHLTFPLLFCDACHEQFERRCRTAVTANLGNKLLLLLLLAPLLALSLIFIAFLIAVPAAVLILVMIVRHHTRKKANAHLLETLRRMPLVGPVIAAEDEYQIRLGRAKRVA